MADPTSYDADFHAWLNEQARLLRERRFDELDIGNLAVEVEDLAKQERRDLETRFDTLLAHLLKWRFVPEERTGTRRGTIRHLRYRIEDAIEMSPSLAAVPAEYLPEAYDIARKLAADETELPLEHFPAACPWAVGEILSEDFLPDISHAPEIIWSLSR